MINALSYRAAPTDGHSLEKLIGPARDYAQFHCNDSTIVDNGDGTVTVTVGSGCEFYFVQGNLASCYKLVPVQEDPASD